MPVYKRHPNVGKKKHKVVDKILCRIHNLKQTTVMNFHFFVKNIASKFYTDQNNSLQYLRTSGFSEKTHEF
jgi:hypothetical protein